MTVQLPPQEPDEMLPGEAELAALYRQLPKNEPGAALDAAVLQAAAQALASAESTTVQATDRRKLPRERGDWVRPKPDSAANSGQPDPVTATPSFSRRKPGSRWLIALSSAATLVLVAGLAWRMRGMPSTATTSGTASYRPVVSSPVDMASPAAAAAPLPPPASAPAAQQVVAQEAVQPTEHVSVAAAPARLQAARTISANGVMKLRSTAPPSVEEATASAAAPLADAGMSSTAKPVAENYSSEPVAKAPVAEAAATAPDNQANRAEVAAAPVPAPPPPPPMLAPMPMQATAAAPMPAPAPPTVAEKTTAANPADTPAQELDKIQQLFAQGHDDEARQRLATFHQAHPQWELPAQLDAQLHKP